MHLTNPPQPLGRGLLANAPVLSPLALNVAVATYLMVLCNQTFWGHLLRIFDGWTVAALVFAAAVWALMLLVISLLAVRRLQKPVLVALLIIAAVTSYYVDVLGVVVDRDMIQNAMTTTFAESKHLITAHFIGHVALYGLLAGGAGAVGAASAVRTPVAGPWGLGAGHRRVGGAGGRASVHQPQGLFHRPARGQGASGRGPAARPDGRPRCAMPR